MKRISHRC